MSSAFYMTLAFFIGWALYPYIKEWWRRGPKDPV